MAESHTPHRHEATTDEALGLAVQLHRSGKLDGAEATYRAVLGADPGNRNALHLLGMLLAQRDRPLDALPLLERSIALDGSIAGWHNNLANVLQKLGRIDEAAAAYGRSLQLDPDDAPTHNNLGALHRLQRRPAQAQLSYERALAIDPGFLDAWNNLGNLLRQQGREEEAVSAYCEALLLRPDNAHARGMKALALHSLGRAAEAAAVYRAWLVDEPDNPVPLHHLAGCTKVSVPDRADDSYVETVFDGFAAGFDAQLEQLGYSAPALMAAAVERLHGLANASLDVLDAGCGTGLCGPLLRPFAKHLTGVDLSVQMLELADRRGGYDRLFKVELTAFLQAMPQAFDLVVSADTLCYFGRLEAVLAATRSSLRAGGRLLFTVEALVAADDAAVGEPRDIELHPHGRYSHSRAYVERTMNDAGFADVGIEPATLRFEGGKPVFGWVVGGRVAGEGAR